MKNSRRTFPRSSSRVGAGLGLTAALPWNALAISTHMVPANDKINIGVMGINGMGWSDLRSMIKIPEAQVIALCDVDENVLNFRKYELAKSGIKTQTYVDYRKMLENKDINVVIIGTPDHWHCLIMTDACGAGEDVYVEKPVGNSIEECRAMVAAQQRHNKVVQAGQWQATQPHMGERLTYAKSGTPGQNRTVKG